VVDYQDEKEISKISEEVKEPSEIQSEENVSDHEELP
jgi:hypothetical protein